MRWRFKERWAKNEWMWNTEPEADCWSWAEAGVALVTLTEWHSPAIQSNRHRGLIRMRRGVCRGGKPCFVALCWLRTDCWRFCSSTMLISLQKVFTQRKLRNIQGSTGNLHNLHFSFFIGPTSTSKHSNYNKIYPSISHIKIFIHQELIYSRVMLCCMLHYCCGGCIQIIN